jgi:hypothetical protein
VLLLLFTDDMSDVIAFSKLVGFAIRLQLTLFYENSFIPFVVNEVKKVKNLDVVTFSFDFNSTY